MIADKIDGLRERFPGRRFVFAVDEAGVHVRENICTARALDNSCQTYTVVPICSGKTLVEAVMKAEAGGWTVE